MEEVFAEILKKTLETFESGNPEYKQGFIDGVIAVLKILFKWIGSGKIKACG